MPSPFPGMDPYIEQRKIWSDFHQNMAVEIQGQLNRVIQPRYVARLTPYVTYETIEIAIPESKRPDVGVYQAESPAGIMAGAISAIAPAPVESVVPLEFPLRLMTVEIHDVDSLTLVTAIEILSPVNKQRHHQAYRDYQIKRRDLLRSGAHLIEVDLLRGGLRPPLKGTVPPAPYYVTLSRVERRPTVEVWPIPLRDKLPVVPAPLLRTDPDVAVDLGAAVVAVYERGGYGSLIDYRDPPPPPRLPDADQAWLDEWLQQQGKR